MLWPSMYFFVPLTIPFFLFCSGKETILFESVVALIPKFHLQFLFLTTLTSKMISIPRFDTEPRFFVMVASAAEVEVPPAESGRYTSNRRSCEPVSYTHLRAHETRHD